MARADIGMARADVEALLASWRRLAGRGRARAGNGLFRADRRVGPKRKRNHWAACWRCTNSADTRNSRTNLPGRAMKGSSTRNRLPVSTLGRRQNDEAFRWLDEMVATYGPASAHIVKTDLYRRLHADPRWPAFLEKHGATDEQYSSISFDPDWPPEIDSALERERLSGR